MSKHIIAQMTCPMSFVMYYSQICELTSQQNASQGMYMQDIVLKFYIHGRVGAVNLDNKQFLTALVSTST